MAKIEKIQGAGVLKLIKEIKNNGMPLKMQVIKGDYERFILIAEIRKWMKAHYFIVKYSEDFRIAIDELDDLRMRFEFAGKDDVNYAFETGSEQISRNTIWLRLPETVYRYQRREHFRLEAPRGTRLNFKINDTYFNLLVINISLGGTLGVLVSLTREMELVLQKETPNMLESVELIFPDNNNDEYSKLTIKQCKIKRQQINPQTQRRECAIEFAEIAEDQQEQLKTLFYQWQRAYLKRRKRFMA